MFAQADGKDPSDHYQDSTSTLAGAGSEGVMALEDTDNGELDGDTTPQHIDDAVLTAAVYLCESTDVAARATSGETLES